MRISVYANGTSALYHTLKILLYRPMLSKHQDVTPDGRNLQPMQHYLMECVSSATSIISIFDLFSRSFGIGHCVLSLAYSVYIASSIFLLQIQSGTDDGNALHRLEYCVRTLTQVRSLSPGNLMNDAPNCMDLWLTLSIVITSPLTMIHRQLAYMGINMSIPDMPGTDPLNSGMLGAYPSDSVVAPVPDPVYPPGLFQFSFLETSDAGGLAFDPEVLESMTLIEPLSVRVGTID